MILTISNATPRSTARATPLPRRSPADGYLETRSLPPDPWGNDYQFLSPGTQGDIDIFSLGADSAAGGEGINADIGNWDLQ